jgi:hypothetical protein
MADRIRFHLDEHVDPAKKSTAPTARNEKAWGTAPGTDATIRSGALKARHQLRLPRTDGKAFRAFSAS